MATRAIRSGHPGTLRSSAQLPVELPTSTSIPMHLFFRRQALMETYRGIAWSDQECLKLDLSLLKTTRVSERLNLQFRAELFNILNHTNFGTPNAVLFTSSSRVPSSTAGL